MSKIRSRPVEGVGQMPRSPPLNPPLIEVDATTKNVCQYCVEKHWSRSDGNDNIQNHEYWIKRRKNNEAARKSREKRKLNDILLERKVMHLAEENRQLRSQLLSLKIKYGEIGDLQFPASLDSNFDLNSTCSNFSSRVFTNTSRDTSATVLVNNSATTSDLGCPTLQMFAPHLDKFTNNCHGDVYSDDDIAGRVSRSTLATLQHKLSASLASSSTTGLSLQEQCRLGTDSLLSEESQLLVKEYDQRKFSNDITAESTLQIGLQRSLDKHFVQSYFDTEQPTSQLKRRKTSEELVRTTATTVSSDFHDDTSELSEPTSILTSCKSNTVPPAVNSSDAHRTFQLPHKLRLKHSSANNNAQQNLSQGSGIHSELQKGQHSETTINGCITSASSLDSRTSSGKTLSTPTNWITPCNVLNLTCNAKT